MNTQRKFVLLGAILLMLGTEPLRADPDRVKTRLAAAQYAAASVQALAQADTADGGQENPSPEEKMRQRFPQPVKVGDLIGLPVLDYSDSTIGYVRHVVRTPQGKIQLVVSHGGWFGWGGRPVAVPIETVASFGRQLAALEWSREEFSAAPTWSAADSQQIPANEIIRIALTKR